MKTQSERNKEYYEMNKDREKQRSLEYYHQNKEKIDREKKKEYMTEYLKTYSRKVKTPEEKEQRKIARRERYQNDKEYRDKVNAQVKATRQRNPNTKLNYRLKKEFGITLEEYNQMAQNQNGKCAICQTTELPKGMKNLFVDHCHLSGNVRGLLCSNCNFGLGHFKDDVNLLLKAIEYLNKQ